MRKTSSTWLGTVAILVILYSIGMVMFLSSNDWMSGYEKYSMPEEIRSHE